jgi:DNA-binding LacI/PurR family transcriptional regulator
MSTVQKRDILRKKSVTIRQVAELAGVSVATVSRALSGSDLVSRELVERVTVAARSLNYKPNQIARSFRTQKTRMVGLVISDIENPFFTSVVRGVEKVLRDSGYSLLLTDSNEDEKIEWEHLQNLRAEGVAGIILTPSARESKKYEEYIESGMTLVAIDRAPSNLKVDRVTVNNMDGVQGAVRHLVELGHEKIGFITGLPKISSAYERQMGYERGMNNYDLPIRPEWIQQGNFRRDGGYAAMTNILALKDRPTAVISGNNLMTLGALAAIYESNVKVPEEMSIVGYDDMVWAGSLNPPLTVIAQPTLELGRVAAQLLMDRIQDGSRSYRHIILDTQLIVRASSGPRR